LTVPKIKDLVNTSSQKYENIYNTIKNNSSPLQNQNHLQNAEYTLIDLLPKEQEKENETNMKSELKKFLKSTLSTF
jgi:hypothetical protein